MQRTLIASSVALSLALAGPAAANPEEADVTLLRFVNERHSPAGDAINGFLSNDIQTMVVPLATSYALGGDYRAPVRVLEAQLLGLGLSQGLKFVIQRPRPFVTHPGIRTPDGPEGGFSMPSGHATVAFASATAVAEAFPAWAVPAYGWATLVALSRVYNGVHYPSDIMAGALLGVGSAKLAPVLFSGLNAQLNVTDPAVGFSMSF